MPLQDLTSPPTAPSRSDDPDTFIERADDFVAWFGTFVSEMQTLTAQLEASAALIAAAPAYADTLLKVIADSNLTPAADRGVYLTSSSVAALFTLTTAGRALIDDADAAAQRTTLGLGALAVLASINDGNWSGTDLAVANGGTGASTAADARTNLGLGALATLGSVDDSNWSGTDLAVANGGTGASTASAARTNLAALGLTSATFGANTIDLSITLSNGETLRVVGGKGSLAANTADTLSFGITFGAAPVALVSGGPTGTTSEGDVHTTADATTTGVAIVNSGNATGAYHWLAIGRA